MDEGAASSFLYVACATTGNGAADDDDDDWAWPLVEMDRRVVGACFPLLSARAGSDTVCLDVPWNTVRSLYALAASVHAQETVLRAPHVVVARGRLAPFWRDAVGDFEGTARAVEVLGFVEGAIALEALVRDRIERVTSALPISLASDTRRVIAAAVVATLRDRPLRLRARARVAAGEAALAGGARAPGAKRPPRPRAAPARV